MVPHKVPILDFPTEVLSDIFDHLAPGRKDLASFFLDYSDIFAVRGTCRTFRAISSTLRLWYDDDFDLSDVVRGVLPRADGRIDVTDLEIGERRLFACLASDKVLLDTMSRKQHWSFRTVPTLIQYTDTIPNFRTTITKLNYEVYHSCQDLDELPQVSINDGLAHLGRLPNLTSLSISTEGGKICLNQIVVTCSSLKNLEFYQLENGWYSGSLSGLRRLEKLVVYDYQLPKKTGPRQHLLPIDSALSLTNLRFFARGTRNNVYHSKHLLNFINLTKLTVNPLCDRMCKTIISADFLHLRKFVAVIHGDTNISLDDMLRLLQSRSLNSLRELIFLVEPERWEFSIEHGYLEIIRTITSHLSNLEDLQLTTGINTAWCELFSKSRNLKSIAWVCFEEECIDCTDMFTNPIDYMSDDSLEDMASLVTEKLNAVFEQFVEKPSVYVKILSEEIYDQWDELFEEYDG